MLDHGATVDLDEAIDCEGLTELIIACKNDNKEIVNLLITAGADINRRDYFNDKTPLMHASKDDNIEIMQLLLDLGADINIQNQNVNNRKKYSLTALMCASENGKQNAVKLLLDHGADMNCVDSQGNTAEQLATTPEMKAIFEQAKINNKKKKRQNDKDFLDPHLPIKKDWK